MHEIDGALAAVARSQHGLVTTAQVRERGGSSTLTTRRCRSGHWQFVAPGVLRIGGAPITFAQRALAAVLSVGGDAVVSHRTAAVLGSLVRRTTVPIEISIGYGRSVRRRGVLVHRSRDLDLADVRLLDGIPVTGPARTILDLGAVAPDDVASAVNAGRRDGAVAWDDLLRCLLAHARPGRGGVGPLRRVVGAHYEDLATDSTAEDEAFEILRSSRAVPLPVSQHPIVCADGVAVTVDFAWPEYGALLEVYGVDHLTNEALQHLDLHRRNQIELAGYRLLVYTGRLLRRQPDQFVHDVRAMLMARGCPLPVL